MLITAPEIHFFSKSLGLITHAWSNEALFTVGVTC